VRVCTISFSSINRLIKDLGLIARNYIIIPIDQTQQYFPSSIMWCSRADCSKCDIGREREWRGFLQPMHIYGILTTVSAEYSLIHQLILYMNIWMKWQIDPYVYVLGLKGSSFFLCCLHYYVYMSQSTHKFIIYPSGSFVSMYFNYTFTIIDNYPTFGYSICTGQWLRFWVPFAN
jgi:hypothetical protein